MNRSGRGKQFEAIIQNTLLSFDGHTIVKTDPPVVATNYTKNGTFTGRFKAAGQCDFEGCFRGLHACLEAKDCHEPMFLKDRIRTGQWDRLYETWRIGGLAAILLRFAGEVANDDQMWLVEFGAVRYLFEKRSRFDRDAVTTDNAHALTYSAFGGASVTLAGLEAALLRMAAARSQGLQG